MAAGRVETRPQAHWARRSARILAWSIALGGLLYVSDRALFQTPAEEWATVDDLSEIPSTAGLLLVPNWLPDTLSWPPERIGHWTKEPGWWYGLRPIAGGEVVLWVGSGPAPPWLGEAAGCLETEPVACPTGWRQVSTETPDGVTIRLVAGPEVTHPARILKGLRPHGPTSR